MTNQQRRDVLKAFDPTQPLGSTDDRYISFESYGVRGSGHKEIIQVVKTSLDAQEPKGASHQLFTGYPGSGKTTELLRLKDVLNQDLETPTVALLIDGEDYYNSYSELQVTDVLRVLAYVLDREATKAEGRDPDAEPGYLRRFWDFLQTDVQFEKLGFKFSGIEIMAELRNNLTFRKLADEAMTARFQAFADQARCSIEESVGRLRAARLRDRVVVIFDSLEKFRPLNEDDSDRLERSLERVFLEHAGWLKVPCHVIYTFPLLLRYRTTGLGTVYGSEPVVFPMVKIHDELGGVWQPGLDALAQLMKKREGPASVFGPQGDGLRTRIAEASGGYPRDVIRLCRNLIQNEDTFPAADTAVDRVIAQLESEYANVFRDTYLETFVYVAHHHQLPQANESTVRLAGDLIRRFIILSYRNGREWYDLHPLIRRHPKVQRALAGLPPLP